MADFDIFNPQVSKVAKNISGLIIAVHGVSGTGKTPGITKHMPKPLYLACGKSGLSGINNVPFFSITDWATAKKIVKQLCDKKNYDKLHEMYETIVLDEMEVLWKYCEQYICSINGVTKVGEANNGYGAWADLKNEWETLIMQLVSSGFCVVYILHSAPDDTGRMFPVGDIKRQLPIILNHAEIIGYAKGNEPNPETGKAVHSSLMLAGNNEYFARTRNEYFSPCIDDFTGENLIKEYYAALDRQEKAEGITPISREEQDKQYASKEVDFESLMDEVQEYGQRLAEEKGLDTLTEIVEKTLGKNGKVSACTKKQAQAVQIILMDIKEALNE